MKKILNSVCHNTQAFALWISVFFVIISLTVAFDIILPFGIALIIAFLQQDLIDNLSKIIPYTWATICVNSITFGSTGICLLFFIPFLYEETLTLISDFPNIILKASALIQTHSGVNIDLTTKLREIFVTQSEHIFDQVSNLILHYVPSVMSFMIYIVTIPILVFFFNYDCKNFMQFFRGLYPKGDELELIGALLYEQLRYYVRGKIVNMIIIGAVTYMLFEWFHLNYGILLAILMGVASLIPFIGTALASIPLVVIAYAQFDLSAELVYILGGHGLIHIWNENMLVPMIFSKSNDLHPLTILSAVLIFGDLFGVIGVFLAIPLAAAVKILILNWPKKGEVFE